MKKNNLQKMKRSRQEVEGPVAEESDHDGPSLRDAKLLDELKHLYHQLPKITLPLDKRNILVLITNYYSPSSDNFVFNSLRKSPETYFILEYLISEFELICGNNGSEGSPLYDRDIIVMIVSLAGSVLSSNIRDDINDSFVKVLLGLSNLVSHESHKVKRQALTALIDILSKSSSLAEVVFSKLPDYEKILSDWDQGIRKLFIKLLSIVCPLDRVTRSTEINRILEILRGCLYDRDSRVRSVRRCYLFILTFHISKP